MKLLNTKHKRKSARITLLILLLLLFFLFNFGMKYLDPPVEYGVAINFGNSDTGSGDIAESNKKHFKNDAYKENKSKENLDNKSEKQEETIDEKQELKEIITDETTKNDPTVIKSQKKIEQNKLSNNKKNLKKEKPKPSKATTDALKSLLKANAKSSSSKGEGDDKKNGVKGSEYSASKSSKYYGKAGKGSGGNYHLSGRKALSKPVKKPDCQQEGTVAVSIYVDKTGKVTKATPGAKGTTNSAPCLYKAAKEAALQTKWNPDKNAPSMQKGTIIYRFALSQ